MRQEFIRLGVVSHVVIASILAVSLCLISSPPAAAQSVGEYFQISYDPVSFDKTEIHGDEVFNATIEGRAICINDLPLPASEARITSRVVAEHAVSGTKVTLNPNYAITIKPFPCKEGETTEISKVILLQFPAEGEAGDYNVIGELIEAKVKALLWVDVTGYLPQTQIMGSVKYIPESELPTPTPTPTPSLTPTPTPSPTYTPTPSPTPTPTPSPTYTPTPSPAPTPTPGPTYTPTPSSTPTPTPSPTYTPTPAPTTTPTPTPTPMPAPPINWSLTIFGGVVGGILLSAVLIYFLGRRRL